LLWFLFVDLKLLQILGNKGADFYRTIPLKSSAEKDSQIASKKFPHLFIQTTFVLRQRFCFVYVQQQQNFFSNKKLKKKIFLF